MAFLVSWKKRFNSGPDRSQMRHDGKGIARQCQRALVSWLKSVSADDCSRRVVHQLDQADEMSNIWCVAGMVWRQRKWMILYEIQRREAGWRRCWSDRDQICNVCGLRTTFPGVRVCERVFCDECGQALCADCTIRVVGEPWCFACSIDVEDRASLALHRNTEKRNESNEQIFRRDLLFVIDNIEDAMLGKGEKMPCLEDAMTIQQRAMMTVILDVWQTTVLGGTYAISAEMQKITKDKTIIRLHSIAGNSIATLQCLRLKGLFSNNKYQRNLGELYDQVHTLRRQGRLNRKGKLTLALNDPLKNVLCEDDFCITIVDDRKSSGRSNEYSSTPHKKTKRIVNRKLNKLSSNETTQ